MLLSICRKVKQMKRRWKSKVLPEEKTGGGEVDTDASDVLGCLEEGFTGQRVSSGKVEARKEKFPACADEVSSWVLVYADDIMSSGKPRCIRLTFL
ncbi:hypothetical protein R6Q59_010536 [Mikania micrantha]